MTSGAGHDAQMLARICPTSMIFVPSVGSISHNPAEHTRKEIVTRLINLLEQGARHGCDLVVFPELALTTFFPRWHFESQQEIDSFFEVQMPGPDTQALFDVARKLKVGFYLGYAEITQEEGRTRRFNTSILVDQSGAIVEV
jgi:predicted amidohydrolase